MATRLYFNSTDAPAISPAFDSNWEQTGQAIRRKLEFKQGDFPVTALTTSTAVTIPITTTQDILIAQFISKPIGACRIENRNFSMVIGKCGENATTNNAHLAYSLRILAPDGTSRGTVRSSFTTISEFPLFASAATRIIAAGACTATTVQGGDVICLEVGIRANAPTAAGSGRMRFGTPSGVADFALTTALTTDLVSWAEFQQDIRLAPELENFKGIDAGNGLSVTEKIW